jgi:hypothetical protein
MTIPVGQGVEHIEDSQPHTPDEELVGDIVDAIHMLTEHVERIADALDRAYPPKFRPVDADAFAGLVGFMEQIRDALNSSAEAAYRRSGL